MRTKQIPINAQTQNKSLYFFYSKQIPIFLLLNTNHYISFIQQARCYHNECHRHNHECVACQQPISATDRPYLDLFIARGTALREEEDRPLKLQQAALQAGPVPEALNQFGLVKCCKCGDLNFIPERGCADTDCFSCGFRWCLVCAKQSGRGLRRVADPCTCAFKMLDDAEF